MPIYLLSIITYPQKAFTEHADNNMTPFDYSENLGIIKAFDRIHKIGLKVCSRLITIYENKP